MPPRTMNRNASAERKKPNCAEFDEQRVMRIERAGDARNERSDSERRQLYAHDIDAHGLSGDLVGMDGDHCSSDARVT